MSSVKTYSVDFTPKVSSDLASLIIEETEKSSDEATTVRENTQKVKDETAKMLKDIASEINPHIEALGLKMCMFKNHHYTDDKGTTMKSPISLADKRRSSKGLGITITITNPNESVVINKTHIDKADFKPNIFVECKMSEYGYIQRYRFTTVKDFLEKERDNIKDMYVSNKNY